MRASSAVLTDSTVRLWDLRLPASRVLLGRTRAAYVHLDNLIAFSKRDRDGKVDAYLACYLPDEVALLFFNRGDMVNAAVLTGVGRFTAAIPEALRHIRSEPERAEIAFHAADGPLLAAMYATCQQTPIDLPLNAMTPEAIFKTVLEQKVSGVLELISNARVNYLCIKDGRFSGGYFADQKPGEPTTQTVARLFTSTPPEPLPRITVKLFATLQQLPVQAPPAMVTMFRHYVWDLVELAEKEAPNDATKRAEKVRTRLSAEYEVLRTVGGPRNAPLADPIVEPELLAASIALWTREFLDELEVAHPQVAPRLIKDAAREHRYALAAVKFFDRLPWRIEW